MKYIAVGGTIINDMQYADGSRVNGFLGGTIYAANGIKTYTDDIVYITKVGPDWEEEIGEFIHENAYPVEGIFPVLKRTMYSLVEYLPTGEWIGHNADDYDLSDWVTDSQITPEDIAAFCDNETKGIYLYTEPARNPDVDYFGEFRKASPNGKIMWEVPTDLCQAARYESTAEMIKRTDIYSINYPESKALFGTNSEEESVEAIIKLGVPCFFRVGVNGSYMIQDGKAWFAPLIDFDKSVDATGCGNCSTAATIYGFSNNKHPLMTAILSNIASGITAAQYGPYLHYNDELRKYAFESAQLIFDELICLDGAKTDKKYRLKSLYDGN